MLEANKLRYYTHIVAAILFLILFDYLFNIENDDCIYCREKYTKTILSNGIYYNQKYCKKCLSSYITDITDNNIYLDVYLYTKDLECNEHEISKTKEPQNIQECCKNCLEILCFKQLPSDEYFYHYI